MFFIGGFDTSHGPLNVTVPFGKRFSKPPLNFADTLDTKPVENGLISDFTKGASGLFATLTERRSIICKRTWLKLTFFPQGLRLPAHGLMISVSR